MQFLHNPFKLSRKTDTAERFPAFQVAWSMSVYVQPFVQTCEHMNAFKISYHKSCYQHCPLTTLIVPGSSTVM